MKIDKATFTIFIKDQKDEYIDASIETDGVVVVVKTNSVTVLYPWQNITKIVMASTEENEKLS